MEDAIDRNNDQYENAEATVAQIAGRIESACRKTSTVRSALRRKFRAALHFVTGASHPHALQSSERLFWFADTLSTGLRMRIVDRVQELLPHMKVTAHTNDGDEIHGVCVRPNDHSGSDSADAHPTSAI